MQAPLNSGPSRFDHHPVDCATFSGREHGSGKEGSQPFRLAVAAEAAVLIDFHSHLSNSEVVGLLGGTWDESQCTLTCALNRPRIALIQCSMAMT